MHRIATKPGDLDFERELCAVKQTPADILFISTADTELSAIAQVWGQRFRGRLRLMQANRLQHPKSAEYYVDNVLCKSKLAIFRLHGGYGYFPHLLEEIKHVKSHGAKVHVIVLPGTEGWDQELMKFCDFSESLVQQVFSYFRESGIENLNFAADAVELLLENKTEKLPQSIQVPTFGWLENFVEKLEKNERKTTRVLKIPSKLDTPIAITN